AHSDDQGLVLPPKIAPQQVVIVPIYKGEESKAVIDAKANEIMKELKAAGIRVKYDNNDNSRPGWKFAEYELKGVPVRLAIGLRDLENNIVELARRDTKEKLQIPIAGLSGYIETLLNEIQQNLYNNALTYREQHITSVDSWDEFVKTLNEKGGFVSAHWDGTAETETEIKEKTKATIRCIPLNNPPEEGECIFSGKPSKERGLFAIAY
ncbi:MAG TPA: His/Gly/Thr/Pro-type tRNA ligase C-terminal domain-containing protein, partial [Chitinophagaceae bacterium]|nr:His/Gly/Thr/Pro-type tRNA ligase C-terminal domain-containing protein [Chitinophagaceae bacterium]